MPMVEGKNKYGKGGIPLQLDSEGNIILSSDTIIDVDDVDTIQEVVKVTTLGTITNAVTVTGSVTANQGGTWNIGTVSTVSSVTDVVNVQDVDNVVQVDEVTKITEPVYAIDDNRFGTNMYSSGYNTIESGTSEYEFDELTVTYDATYLNKPGVLTIGNLSGFYDLNVQVRQVLTFGASAIRIATAQFTVPSVEKVRPTTDAYSSNVLYNKTGSVWTDNSIHFDSEVGWNTTFPITEVDDAIYFGCKSKFNSIALFIDTAAVYDATLVWELWNGSAWVSPTVLIDNSNELQSTAGQYYIALFEGLTTWTANQPDGASMVNQYWMRLRCSAFTSCTTNPTVRTVLFKPVQYNSVSSYEISEVFGNAGTSTIIMVSPTSDIDDTHELVYSIGLGGR